MITDLDSAAQLSSPLVLSPQPNKTRPLREFILDTRRASNSQRPPGLPHMGLVVKAPELPGTVLASKTIDDSLTSWVLECETGTIVDDIVDHDPDAIKLVFGGAYDGARDEGQLAVV